MFKYKDNCLIWLSVEEFYGDKELKSQIDNLRQHPWLLGNVVLTPDGHPGYGMPIGGVVALKGAVCPNMVGVDIGCGMLAVATGLTDITTEQLKDILNGIRNRIPVGFNHHNKDQENAIFNSDLWSKTIVCCKEFASAKRQLGTLGGGNHFIEIQKGDDGRIWFMIHSGSRNLGYKVANHYNEIAKQLCELWNHTDIVKNDLAVLPYGTSQYNDYIQEMNLCLEFAHANRKHMAQVIREEFKRVIPDCEFASEINIHHNYAALENHYGQNVMVHRKGATLARDNTVGIIPGSQGTCSYIVRGKGNEASLCSCSHGAGRKMSRKKAREQLSVEAEAELMNSKGILHAIRGKDDLDEAPSAYKDIDVVMEEQKDLVDIVVKLTPLAVIKG